MGRAALLFSPDPLCIVIDLLDHPELAKADQIVAIPTLVRRLPPPIKKIIGDLSMKERILVSLEVETSE